MRCTTRLVRTDLTSGAKSAPIAKPTSLPRATFRRTWSAMKISTNTAHGEKCQPMDVSGSRWLPQDGRLIALVTGFGLRLGVGHGLTTRHGDLRLSIMGDGYSLGERGPGRLGRSTYAPFM